MGSNDYFIESLKLQKNLSKDEIYNLLIEVKNGNDEAKNTLIEGNIRLVLYEVVNRFNTVSYDKKDLVSIGIFGLIKAINTFEVTKNNEFSTYATRCIDNEILMFLRKLKKDSVVDSLDRVIGSDRHGNELRLEDKLSYDNNLDDKIVNNEMYCYIDNLVDNLNDVDREIIKLSFGFYDNKKYTQEEIANILSVARPWVCKRKIKILKRLGTIIKQKGYMESELSDKLNDNKKLYKSK